MDKAHLIEEMVAKDPIANPWEQPIKWKTTLSFLSYAPTQLVGNSLKEKGISPWGMKKTSSFRFIKILSCESF